MLAFMRNTALCLRRPELEQHNIGGGCGCGLRGLQAARQEPQLPRAGACQLPLAASHLFSPLLEATQTILHLIGPVLPILCLMADSMCSSSTVLSARVGMVRIIQLVSWMRTATPDSCRRIVLCHSCITSLFQLTAEVARQRRVRCRRASMQRTPGARP